MSATNAQQTALAQSNAFRNKVRASILKKALTIVENQGSYTAPQITLAKAICKGQSMDPFYLPLASSTNFVASTVSYDFATGVIDSDVSEAALDSQVYTVVFVDLA